MLQAKINLTHRLDSSNNVALHCKIKEIIANSLGQIQTCKEDFPEHGRVVYSSVSMLIQYFLPTLTISVVYYQVSSLSKL